jgi:hypothetical protein
VKLIPPDRLHRARPGRLRRTRFSRSAVLSLMILALALMLGVLVS